VAGDVASHEANTLQQCILDERQKDPWSGWIRDSPNREVVTMGAVPGMEKCPIIPIQRATITSTDRKAYSLPQVCGAIFEDTFITTIGEYQTERFHLEMHPERIEVCSETDKKF